MSLTGRRDCQLNLGIAGRLDCSFARLRGELLFYACTSANVDRVYSDQRETGAVYRAHAWSLRNWPNQVRRFIELSGLMA